MKIKNIVLMLLLTMLLIASFSTINPALNMSKQEKISEKFEIDIFPIQNDDSADSVGDPIVVITYPEDGSEINEPYFEVIGYASDPDGLYFMEWTYQSGIYYYYDNETLNGAYSYGFRIRVFYIHPGSQTVTVTYYDYYNNSGQDSVTVYYGENDAPETPARPNGPNEGSIGLEYTYSTHSTDTDNDDIRYGWDWDGDNTVDEWTEYYLSGEIVNTSHIWTSPGTYNVKVKADDSKQKSGFSQPLTVHITDNSPPTKPETPMGSSSGKTGISYTYSTYSYDSEGDNIYYLFDWGDGTEPEWDGPYGSGDIVSASHIWTSEGSFSVKVKAKDDPNGDGDLSDGLESVWSDPLPVSMPKLKSKFIFEKIFTIFKFKIFSWLI